MNSAIPEKTPSADGFAPADRLAEALKSVPP